MQVFNMELTSCHPFGTWNFEVVPTFLENLFTFVVSKNMSQKHVRVPFNITYMLKPPPQCHLENVIQLLAITVLPLHPISLSWSRLVEHIWVKWHFSFSNKMRSTCMFLKIIKTSDKSKHGLIILAHSLYSILSS